MSKPNPLDSTSASDFKTLLKVFALSKQVNPDLTFRQLFESLDEQFKNDSQDG